MFWNTLTGEQKKNAEENIVEHLKGAATFLQVSESTFYVATRLGVWWISDLNCIRFLAVRQKYVPLVSRRRFRGWMSRFVLRYCHEFRQEKLKKIAEVSRKNSRYSGFSHNRLSLQPLLWHCCCTVHSLNFAGWAGNTEDRSFWNRRRMWAWSLQFCTVLSAFLFLMRQEETNEKHWFTGEGSICLSEIKRKVNVWISTRKSIWVACSRR